MIRRDLYLKKIRPFMNKELIKVITGIRRCGKSVMLEIIQKELLKNGVATEAILTYNFESLTLAPLCTAQALHRDVMEKSKAISGKVYLFFDEVQEVKDWEKAINSFRVDLDCDIYITGSNSKLLSGELASYLAGRYVEFVMYPLSFREFFDIIHEQQPNLNTAACFQQYMIYGGMPYLWNLQYQDEPVKQYLYDLYNAIELKDIIRRKKFRDVDLLERILAYVTANIGNTFSATTISKYLKSEGRKVAPETILNYLHAGNEAFLFYPVKRQDIAGKKILSVQEKYYLADHGIREAVIGGNLKDINLILENIIFLELKRRGYKVTVGKYADKEIDFIAQRQSERIYIQVCYLLATPETAEREFGVYRNIRDNYPKYVLSMDEFDMSQDGIIHQNIRDFLLQET
ncbi:hypothetical protein SAMN05216582_11415 [Selenomonas ruminantium]|uniref:ATPase n=1 Tax=Selenomonas ruminantium TaxID=971 RepID=A0A1M6UQK1_SELRU|nr:ATP-binding protein [Selenomonas ruminantium]SHK71502.1 hypothetical protein SAMN05216582_11415 [Selenomonas ruminantium]